MKEYIKLQHAHVNQHTKNGEKGTWKIEENITDKNLGELPARLTHLEVFAILKTMKEFELEAFNVGISFGKEEYKKVFEEIINNLKRKLDLATEENERLAAALDRITRMAN